MNQNQKPTNTVLIPQGAFIMGTDIEDFYGTALVNSEHAKLDEAPMHVRFLEAYLIEEYPVCLLYTSPSPRDRTRSRMPSSA